MMAPRSKSSVRSFALGLACALALTGVVGCADVRPPEPLSGEYAARANDTVDPSARAPGVRVVPVSAKSDASDARAETESPRGANAGAPTGAPPTVATPTLATSHDYQLPVPTLAQGSTAMRVMALSDGACAKELQQRKLPFEPSKQAADGVSSAWRITGPLHGVRFVTPAAPSLFGVIDCRLALAMDDLAGVLAQHGVVTVRVDNFYRPNAHLPGKKKKSQHAFAMAIDLTSLELSDGTKLTPPADWHAPIGSVSCGPDAVLESTEARAVVLRDMVCDVARHGVFHHMLTPSYDAAHQSHFHFDVAKDAKSILVH